MCLRANLREHLVHGLALVGLFSLMTVLGCAGSSVPPTPSLVGPTSALPSPTASVAPSPPPLDATASPAASGNLTVIPTFAMPTDIPDEYEIHLQVGSIDSREGEPPLPEELRIDEYPPGESGYYLIQFTGAILPSWKTAVEKTGAELLGYVPNNAFIVRMTEAQLGAVAAMDVVQWEGIFQPAYRISPDLPSPLEGLATVVVLTFPGADLAGIEAQLQDWGGAIESTSENEFGGKIRVSVDLSHIVALARTNGVMWIEPWVEPGIIGP